MIGFVNKHEHGVQCFNGPNAVLEVCFALTEPLRLKVPPFDDRVAECISYSIDDECLASAGGTLQEDSSGRQCMLAALHCSHDALDVLLK